MPERQGQNRPRNQSTQTTTNTLVGAVREPPLPAKHGLKRPSTNTKSQKSKPNPKNPNSHLTLVIHMYYINN